ncbi:MAG: hypothetical protein ABIB93_06870 [Chloroflexota bacterium]
MAKKISRAKRARQREKVNRDTSHKITSEQILRDTLLQNQEPYVTSSGDEHVERLSEPISRRRLALAAILVSLFCIICIAYFFFRNG